MAECVVSVRGLTKVFFTGFLRRRTRALAGVDLDVYRNEVLGFLGPNGAGKTTTIKVLLGIVFPSGGSATIMGRPLGSVEARQKIGFLPEAPYFYDYLTGAEFLDFYARFHGLGSRERRRSVQGLMERVGVAHAAKIPLRKYSKGMLQRIGMAQALLGDPELVILDEPMSGMDPLGRGDMREIIHELKEKGKTVFFSSHVLPDVEQICDRVCIIHKGRVLDTGSLEAMMEPRVELVDLQFKGLPEKGIEKMEKLAEDYPELRVTSKAGLVLVSAPGWEAADEAESIGREQGARLVSLQPRRQSLEEYFLMEIGRSNEGGPG